MKTLVDYLAHIEQCMPEAKEIFTQGQCHTLAYCLQQLFGGQLLAGIKKGFDADELAQDPQAPAYCLQFSHMVYQDKDGQLWDIKGSNADERWENDLDLNIDQPDEDNLCWRLDWEPVQTISPQCTRIHEAPLHIMDTKLLTRLMNIYHQPQLTDKKPKF